MIGLTRYLRGYVRLWADTAQQDPAQLLNLLATSDMVFWDLRRQETGLTLCVSLKDAQHLAAMQPALQVTVLSQHGLVPLLYRYRRRVGIPLGMLLFCMILWLSGQFAWSVEVEGNETVPKEEILSGLEALGCGVGSYLPRLDCYRLSKEYLLSEPRLSWVAVVRDGNVLTVRVRERHHPPAAIDPTLANLVAGEDGVIVSTALSAGQSVVGTGDTVRKGELLVSGLSENKTGSYTLTGAQGRVFARVERELRVEIPLLQREICQTESLGSEKIVKIFGKSIKFSKMGGNLVGKYGTIREERDVVLFGRVTLPIHITTVRYLRNEERTVSYTQAEALALAQTRLQTELDALSQAVQLLSAEQPQQTVTDTSVILTVRVKCIADIAQPQLILQQ